MPGPLPPTPSRKGRGSMSLIAYVGHVTPSRRSGLDRLAVSDRMRQSGL